MVTVQTQPAGEHCSLTSSTGTHRRRQRHERRGRLRGAVAFARRHDLGAALGRPRARQRQRHRQPGGGRPGLHLCHAGRRRRRLCGERADAADGCHLQRRLRQRHDGHERRRLGAGDLRRQCLPPGRHDRRPDAPAGSILANGTDTVSPAANATSFAFALPVAFGGSYSVTVQQQPAGLTCVGGRHVPGHDGRGRRHQRRGDLRPASGLTRRWPVTRSARHPASSPTAPALARASCRRNRMVVRCRGQRSTRRAASARSARSRRGAWRRRSPDRMRRATRPGRRHRRGCRASAPTRIALDGGQRREPLRRRPVHDPQDHPGRRRHDLRRASSRSRLRRRHRCRGRVRLQSAAVRARHARATSTSPTRQLRRSARSPRPASSRRWPAARRSGRLPGFVDGTGARRALRRPGRRRDRRRRQPLRRRHVQLRDPQDHAGGRGHARSPAAGRQRRASSTAPAARRDSVGPTAWRSAPAATSTSRHDANGSAMRKVTPARRRHARVATTRQLHRPITGRAGAEPCVAPSSLPPGAPAIGANAAGNPVLRRTAARSRRSAPESTRPGIEACMRRAGATRR